MPGKKIQIRNSTAEFLIFSTQANENTIEVRVQDHSVWLTQKMIAALFETTKQNIGQHLKNIFEEAELREVAVVKKFFTTAADGKQYDTTYYNLDAIISIGYRVNSQRATQFRQWATGVLRDFAIRGYVLDKERLKNGAFLGQEYYDALLAEIREIRASERRFYQKITDIYATAMDYNADDATTQTFFASVQNKLHFAIHGNTAAELIFNRANSEKAHMGLTTWKNAPSGKIIKTDVSVAKNYLTEKEILGNAGKVTQAIAKAFAESEFEKYRIVQDNLFESDFDKAVKKALNSKNENPTET